MTVTDDPQADYGRTPPQDLAAEQSVLGGMLLSRNVVPEVVDILRGDDFYRPAHETIYAVLVDLYERGEPGDAITVSAELARRGELVPVGGPAYLHTLISSVPTAANAAYYARIVKERAVLRRLVAAGTRIVQLGYATDGGDIVTIVDAAQAEVGNVLTDSPREDRASGVEELLADLVTSLDAPVTANSGPVWGWLDLDEVMHPLTPGKLVVIGARPSVGKSLALGCVAAHTAFTQGLPVLLHTLEMTRHEVMQRLLARQARVELGHIIKHELTDHDRVRIERAIGQMTGRDLVIDETRGLTPSALRASIRRQKQRPGVVLVDYLQLMRKGERAESRLQEVSEITRELKVIAGDEGVCIVTGAQLNRGAATDRAPAMADLRESGEIEQSADDVVLLDRDKEGKRVPDGEVAFIVEKNRQGAAGMTIHLANQAHYGMFGDLGRE